MFNMIVKGSLGLIFLSFVFNAASGQNANTYEVIRTLTLQMNVDYPIADSLYPFVFTSFNDSDWSFLTKKEKIQIRRSVRKGKGIKINQDSLQGRIFVSASLLFEAFRNFDSTSIKVIEQYRPFYMLSNPLFFANNKKAIVALNLIKGFGYTYIFEKHNRDWVIIKSVYRWM